MPPFNHGIHNWAVDVYLVNQVSLCAIIELGCLAFHSNLVSAVVQLERGRTKNSLAILEKDEAIFENKQYFVMGRTIKRARNGVIVQTTQRLSQLRLIFSSSVEVFSPDVEKEYSLILVSSSVFVCAISNLMRRIKTSEVYYYISNKFNQAMP